jgi:hypothetical protein
MSERFSPEQQIAALLDMAGDLDNWTSKFVASLNEWVKAGRRLTERQREVLADKFDEYDPASEKLRNQKNFTDPRTGRRGSLHGALAFLSNRIDTLDVADACFVRRATRMAADGGPFTARTANRIKAAFLRAQPGWPDLPAKPVAAIQAPTPSPKPHPATILEFKPSPRPDGNASAEVAMALAELVEFKGRLH